ncbi:SDR family NAD(P)-dependent oxidoreductase [Nocardioides sp.]|uniref:SDR family NAD(P)-dependent oxidoreductase n=1 Tax=Nocardioides sp. TaxID=35761 RepID=UPI003515DF8E
MRSFSDSVAAVTGAGSGIGRALALQLAEAGADLALADLSEAGLAETVGLIAARSPERRVTTTVLDVADEAAVYAWADAVVAEHGRVDLVINNAGVALSGLVSGLSLADYRWIMDINFWGVVYGTKAFLPHLEVTGGHVVNLSSVFGITAQPLMSGYNASKYAVRGFTESLRQDLELTGSRVSATCVHPGGIKTNIAQSARMDASVAAATGHADAASTKEFERTFITTADTAAAQILKAVRRNKRRVLVGPDAKLYDVMVRLAPVGYQRVITGVVKARSNRKGASASAPQEPAAARSATTTSSRS